MNVRKRGLALLMCICMIFTLLPFSAFADDTADPDVVYGKYDNGTWTQNADLTAENTYTNSATGTNVKYSKTAVSKGNDTYDITLKIESTTSSVAPGASAVVLVIDRSYSMNCCATCNNATYYDDFNYVHSKNCEKGSGWVQYADTRLKAAQDAAIAFARSYGATGTGRYLSIVTFCGSASSVRFDRIAWLDVSNSENLSKVESAINSISLGSATNLSDGLSKATDRFKDAQVSNITNRYTVLLTDGEPNSPSGWGNDPATAATNSATNLKNVCELYTVCVGAENTSFNGTTVGVFLKDSIASEGSAIYAYNTNSRDQLIAAFNNIFKSIEQGLSSGFTVTDPMGQYIELQNGSLTDCTINDGTITWTPADGTTVTNPDGSKTYTYELTYTVKLNTSANGFVDGKYYPANGETTLAFNDGGTDKTLSFNVPGVKGNAPTYTVTYNKGDHGSLAEQDNDGNVVHSNVRLGSATPEAPEVTADSGYYFTGWEPTIAETVTGNATYTAQYAVRSDLSYTVHYYLNGTSEKVQADKVVGGKTFGQSYTESPDKIDGYTWVSSDAKTVTVSGGTNEINFYYYKNVTLTAEDRTVTYNGEEQTVNTGYDVSVKTDSGESIKLSGVTFKDVYASGTGKDAGQYEINFKDGTVGTVDASAKYIVTETVPGVLTITKAKTLAITAEGYSDVYDGQTHSGTVTAQEGAELSYSIDGGKTWSAEAPTIKDFGTINVIVKASLANYEEATATYTLNVTKRYVSITSQSAEKTYDGYPLTMHEAVIGRDGFVNGEGVNITYSGTQTNAGSSANTFAYTLNDGTLASNYDIVTEYGVLVVNPVGTVSVTITGNYKTYKYDGSAKTVSGYTFEASDSKYTANDFVFSGTASATSTDAEKVMMGLDESQFKNTNANFEKVTFIVKDGYVEVTQIPVIFTGETDTQTFNGNEIKLTGITQSGLLDGHTYSGLSYSAKGTNAGTYPGAFSQNSFAITDKDGNNVTKNYKIEFAPGALTVNKVGLTEVTVIGTVKHVVYDGTEQTVTGYTFEASDSKYTANDFVFSGTASASGKNVGIYNMGLKAEQFTNVSNNYETVQFVVSFDGQLEVMKRDVTVTAGSARGLAPITCDEYTVSGLADGDVLASVKITGVQKEIGKSPNVASDAVINNANGENVNANYNIVYVDGVLEAYEVLNKEIHFNYVIGYTDGTIRPDNNISRAEVATIFFRLLTDEAREQYSTTEGNFSDVKDGMWCNRAVATLTNMGIIKGYTDGSFRPNAQITRAELATIIARFAKLDVNTKTFSDINGHWAQKNIELAAGNGWINGYTDGTFRPNSNITRAETFAMINRVLDRLVENVSDLLPTSDMNMWSDNMDVNAWYYKDIQEATNYHKCDRIGNSLYETWTEKVADIDWASYQI